MNQTIAAAENLFYNLYEKTKKKYVLQRQRKRRLDMIVTPFSWRELRNHDLVTLNRPIQISKLQ